MAGLTQGIPVEIDAAVERAVGAQEVAEETSNSALITVLVVGAVLLTLIAICVGVMCMNGMFKAAPPSASLAAKVPVEMMPADASSAEVEMAAEVHLVGMVLGHDKIHLV